MKQNTTCSRWLTCVPIILLALVVASRSLALTLVVPVGLGSREGTGASGILDETAREQTVYAATNFPAGTISITALRFRPNVTDYLPGEAFSSTPLYLAISLSTTTRKPGGLSTVFSANVGSDMATVLNGAVTVSSAFTGPATGPKAFDITIPLSHPFTYNPALGNLLVDIQNFSGESATPIDAENSTTGGASRVVSSSPLSTTGTMDTDADVLQLTYSQVINTNPPPSTNMASVFVSSGAGSQLYSYDLGGHQVSVASINVPEGVVYDSQSNLYVAEFRQNAILKVTQSGQISTFATAGLSGPVGLAVDTNGNIYAANYFGNTITKYSPSGAESLFASNALSTPYGLALDNAGNLFVANFGNNTITKYTPAGAESLFANTNLYGPEGLAFNSSGSLFVANSANNSIVEFNSSGQSTPFVSASTNPDLANPVGLAFDQSGNLYVANYYGNNVLKFDTQGHDTVFASASLNAPTFVAVFGGTTSSLPSTNSCTPPPAGLAAWWRAEGNALDSAGTNNGTLSSSGAGYAPGLVGEAFRFDGTNGYVQIPDSPSLKPTNVTIEAWVWLDPSLPVNRGGEQIVFKKNTWSAWFEGYSLLKETIDNGNGTYSDHFQFCVSRTGNQVILNSPAIAQRGVWYHVAATYDGNQAVLYVNGVAAATATPGFPLDYDTTPLYIGTTGTWAPYLNMFGGLIDEVSIYNQALTPSQLQAIYAAGSAGKCTPGSTTNPPPPLISTNSIFVAGGGASKVFGYDLSGDQSLMASIDVPEGMVFDANGNLYVAQYYLNAIVKITPGGQVTNFATTGLNHPEGLAMDTNGNIYAANYGGNTITKYSPAGQESLFASTGLSEPYGLAIDGGGNLFVANFGNSTITRYTPAGAESLFASNGLSLPEGLAFNTNGTLFAANAGNNTIVSFNSIGQSTQFADSSAGLNNPLGLAFDKAGDLFVVNYYGPSVEEFFAGGGHAVFASSNLFEPTFITLFGTNAPTLPPPPPPPPSTNTASVFVSSGAGSQVYGYDLSGHQLSVASVNVPEGVVYDSSSNLYVAEYYQNAILKITPGGQVTNFATAGLSGPVGLAIDANGNIYAANNSANTITKYTSTGQESLFASNGLSAPYGLAIDGSGNLFVANSGNNSITKYTPSGGESLFANTNLNEPEGLAFNSNGTLFVANGNNNTIVEFSSSGQSTPFVSASTNPDLANPVGLAFDQGGNLYVANYYGNNVLKFDTQGHDTVFASAGLNAPTFVAVLGGTPSSLPSTNSCMPPPSGLVGWWQGESNAVDIIGGNNGSPANGAGFAPGKVGTAFSFNGINQYVLMSNSPALNLTNALTLEGWVKVAAYSGNDATDIFGKNCPYCFVQYGVGMNNLAGKWVFNSHLGNTGLAEGGTAVQTNTWYHLAETFDGSTLSIYVNGVLDGSVAAVSASPTDEPFIIGGETAGPWDFNGLVDEVSVYNVALTPSQIQAIYSAGSAGKCTSGITNTTPPAPPPSISTNSIFVSSGGGSQVFGFDLSGDRSLLASVDVPEGLVYDSSSNLYVAEYYQNAILKITPGGQVTNFATAGLSGPVGLAIDTNGNLYAANNSANTITKYTSTGQESLFASNGLNAPYGLAIDGGGNLFVANSGNNTVTKYTPAGAESLFANTNLTGPTGLAFNSSGSLFVANSANNSIVEFSPSGQSMLFVNASTNPDLNNPVGLAFDHGGSLYVANYYGNNVLKFDTQGHDAVFASAGLNAPTFVTVFATNTPTPPPPPPPSISTNSIFVASGGGSQVFGYDLSGDRSLLASVNVPEGIVFDTNGNLYVAEYYQNAIAKITPDGQVTNFATAGLSSPVGLALDTNGNIYAANYGNNTITKYNPAGQESLFASNGLSEPYGLAIDGGGNLFVANFGNNTITKYTPAGSESLFASASLSNPEGLAFNTNGTLFAANAGNNTIVSLNANGQPTQFADASAGVNDPVGLAFDRNGDLFVVNYSSPSVEEFFAGGGHAVFASSGLNAPTFITLFGTNAPLPLPPPPPPATNTPSVFVSSGAGSQVYGYDLSGHQLSLSSVQVPEGVVVDTNGNIYVAEYYQSAIVKITPDGQMTTFATEGLSNPLGLAIDTNGNIYAANFGNSTITEYAPNGTESLFASNGLNQPYGVAMDANENLFVINQGNNTITKYSPSGAESLFANTGLNLPGGLAFNPNGLLFAANGDSSIVKFNAAGTPTVFVNPTTNPDLNGPHGLAFDHSGNLYVANYFANNVLKFDTQGHDTMFASTGLNAPTFLTVIAGANQSQQFRSPPPIQLRSASGSAGIVASWSASSPGFVLQSSSDLKDWSNVIAAPQSDGSNLSVTIPSSENAKFFRLIAQ